MAGKTKSVSFITPFGTLRYPKITNPDTKGEYADGKFKTDIVFSDEDYAAFTKQIKEAAKQVVPDGVDIKEVKLPLYDEWDEGKGSRAKSKYRPVVMDAKKTELAESTKIGGGTVARLAVAAAFYKEKGKKGKQGWAPAGVNLYLNKVQIKELQTYGDGADFDEVDGDEIDSGTTSGTSGADDFDTL